MIRSGANGSRYCGKKLEPTTSLNASSACSAWPGITSSTCPSTSEERTWLLIPGRLDPLTATPSAHATTSTAAVLSTAPPTASSARTGCQVIRARIRVPANWSTAWPNDAQISTTNSAPSETHNDGAEADRSPSSCGASQIPSRPPSSSPAVANAPEMKPCQ
jgi:hypothetical protein